jgi:8-oxo-dGTP diphosphatase
VGYVVKVFLDQNGNQIELSFSRGSFGEAARHVLVICQHEDEWLLTKHKVRGLEFPGGKCESGETIEQAAHREVYEETGAILSSIKWIAEYKVTDSKGSFLKAVFFAQVKNMDISDSYHETDGPVLIAGDLSQVRFGNEYSFIMKDHVIEECINYIQNKQPKKE